MELRERSYEVLIASAQPKFNEALTQLMDERRYYSYVFDQSVSSAKRRLLDKSFDILIVNAPLPDDNGVRLALDRSTGSCAVLLLVKNDYYAETFERVCRHGVYVLAKPSPRQLVTQAFDWLESTHERLMKLEKKTVSLEDKMAEIRLVNRAKWLLITNEGMAEDQAHRYIEKLAMDRCVPKGVIAREIIEGSQDKDE